VDDFAAADVEHRLHRAERDLARARREAAEAKDRQRASDETAERLARELGLLAKGAKAVGTPPRWLTEPPKGTKHYGTPWLALSDLHLDEVVQPAEVMGVNAYNRRIAEQRLARTFEAAVEIPRRYWSGIVYDGITVPLMGDIYSGEIHDELTQTNEDTILGSILHWVDHLGAGLSLLAFSGLALLTKLDGGSGGSPFPRLTRP
jgi:hypothetical protein